MFRYIYIALVFINYFFCSPLYSKPLPLTFSRLTVENGLSQGSIYDILQDKKGMMWLATQEGLNLYTGNNLTTYFSHQKNKETLPDNYIRALAQNEEGELWVGTLNGLSRMDMRHNLFKRYNDKDPIFDHINDLVFDSDGVLWIASKGGLSKLDKVSGEPESVTSSD